MTISYLYGDELRKTFSSRDFEVAFVVLVQSLSLSGLTLWGKAKGAFATGPGPRFWPTQKHANRANRVSPANRATPANRASPANRPSPTNRASPANRPSPANRASPANRVSPANRASLAHVIGPKELHSWLSSITTVLCDKRYKAFIEESPGGYLDVNVSHQNTRMSNRPKCPYWTRINQQAISVLPIIIVKTYCAKNSYLNSI